MRAGENPAPPSTLIICEDYEKIKYRNHFYRRKYAVLVYIAVCRSSAGHYHQRLCGYLQHLRNRNSCKKGHLK
nr:MAG TPA: hypothetical protein [Caudoviricetes sp.]